jgi:hypothetical protein
MGTIEIFAMRGTTEQIQKTLKSMKKWSAIY